MKWGALWQISINQTAVSPNLKKDEEEEEEEEKLEEVKEEDEEGEGSRGRRRRGGGLLNKLCFFFYPFCHLEQTAFTQSSRTAAIIHLVFAESSSV